MDPEQIKAQNMLAQVHQGLGVATESTSVGVPEDTHMFPWPKRPTAGRPLSGKGKAQSRGQHSSGRGRGRSGKKAGNWNGWDKI